MRPFKTTVVATVSALALVSTFMACGDDDESGGLGGAGAVGNNGTGLSAASGGIGFGGNGFGASGTGTATVVEDGGVGDGDVCASSTVTADRSPANLLFLIDRTGSMNCNLPPIMDTAACEANPQKVNQGEPSKWEVTETALIDAFTELENADPLPSIGLAYFNSDNYCGYPTAPDVSLTQLSGDAGNDSHLDAITTSLGGVTPQGYTPIIGTTMGAYNYLYTNESSFTGLLFVVLLTDGAETCDPTNTALLVQKAQEANWVGIRTFVLGAPGSEDARAFLSQIAFNGGTPTSASCDHSGSPANVGDCHIDMTQSTDFAQDLADALERISTEILSCTFDVPEPGPNEPAVDLTKVNVKWTDSDGNEEYILQDNSDCNDSSNTGWQYQDNNTKIVLCGQACEDVKNDPGGSVDIELGCQTQEVPN
ncbi:MAG: VWA domain-containing protein [Deltaproteobacteria bacterium]|jgi:hypothetical protein|nr:VWA domain-containing protein [Deltaproteobacteria bacterium]MBW2534073.1 VWA domain-containing protein [Deltaproteobacteria bacterium]